MSVQFYWYPGSSPSRAVKYFLTATNTPYETHFVDIFAGDQKKEDYLKINLRGKVPAIVDGDFQLAERLDKIPVEILKLVRRFYDIWLQVVLLQNFGILKT